MVHLPNQRTSREAKLKNEFYKPTYDNIIARALSSHDRTNTKALLEIANGQVSDASIDYLISPLTDPETKKTIGQLPGTIRDTDLINTVRERNIGEYIGLPYEFTVNVQNADAVFRRNAEVAERVTALMEQGFINLLNEYLEKQQQSENPQPAIDPGIPSAELPDIEQYAKEFIEEWLDNRAIQGQDILNLINEFNDFDTKRIQAFFYWWATEEFYTYREVINGEVYTSVLSPVDCYPLHSGEQFAEDYNAFVITRRTTLTEVKNLYWHKLSKEDQDYLNNLAKGVSGAYEATGGQIYSRLTDELSKAKYGGANARLKFSITDETESFNETIIIWRTEVPVNIRTFIDPLDNEFEEAVPDDYELVEDIDTNLRTEWIEEVWIGRRFGNENEGVYMKPEPCAVQRYDQAKMRPKLPVGGKQGILRDIAINPIAKRLIPYVIIDRIIGLVEERTIAKYEGYLKVIPIGMIKGDKTGTKEEKLFYMKADNTLFYDETSIDFNTVAQGLRVIGTPEVAQFLRVLIDLRDKYRGEALEIANMNDYTLGNVAPSTGKGVMQESIYRARLGNVLSVTMFNAALQRDHTADLEFSKVAYIGGKRSSYFDRTTSVTRYVDVNITEHLESQYGVFVRNAKLDKDKLEQYKALGFNASQNGETELAGKLIEGDSLPKIRRAIKEISKAKQELETQIEKDRNETARYVADVNAESAQADRDVRMYEVDKKAETDIEVAYIKEGAKEPYFEMDEDDLPRDDTDRQLRREELEFKRKDAIEKNNLKRESIRSNERISRDRLKKNNNNKKKE